MTEYKVSFRYARALIDSAIKEGIEDVIFEDFKKLDHMLKLSPDLLLFIGSPIYQIYKKKQVLKDILLEKAKITSLTYAFVLLLLEKRRGELIPDIVVQYNSFYNKLKNILPVEITTALEIDDSVKSTIDGKLSELTGKTIQSIYQVDSHILGGMTVMIDDWVYDSSIRNQLGKIRSALIEGHEIKN